MKSSEILRNAAALIGEHGLARRENGYPGFGFCAVGAVIYSMYGRGVAVDDEIVQVESTLEYVMAVLGLPKMYGGSFRNGEYIATWNDFTANSRYEVIDALNKAADLAELDEIKIDESALALLNIWEKATPVKEELPEPTLYVPKKWSANQMVQQL